MKLTKENYEMQMFDLLEGNLTAEEERLLLHEIENDPFFSQEWKLFSQTMLEPELMVFEGKDALLKEEKAVIIPIRTRWQIFSYAAAVAAVFFGLFWFIQKNPDAVVVEGSTPNTPHIATDIPGNNSSSTPEVQASTKHNLEVREEDINPENPVNQTLKTKQAPELKHHQGIVKGLNKQNTIPEEINEPGTEKPEQIASNLDKEPNEETWDEPKEILVNLKSKKIPIAQPEEKYTPEKVENVLRPDSELNALQPAIAYTGLRAFLRRSAKQAISPFKHPKIKVARVEEQNKPALNISFTSDAYYAAAIVHLR